MPTKKSTSSSSAASAKKATKKTTAKSTKSKAAPKVKEEVIEEEVIEEVIEEEVATSVKKSRAVTKESVEESFDGLLEDIAKEIANLRPDVGKKGGTGIRFLGQLSSRIAKLKAQSLKIAKGKKKAAPSNPNSGFKKKVAVSESFSKFAGWKSDELHSRIDATKFICDYIKDNNLQNPDDKRRIIPDKKLRDILSCDKDVTDFRYCDIQTFMKGHYV
jgi:chromatin remodeling complex protein RSC6